MARRGSLAINAWLLTAGVGCDSGGAYVSPRVGDSECYSFDCAIALGSDVIGDAYVATDYSKFTTIVSATVEPPTLADISIADHAFTLHALAEGTGVLHVVTTAQTTFDQPIRVAALASTTVAILGIPSAVDPLGPFDVIGPHMLRVTAVHRDATGAPLLGHGFETWTATGAELADVATIGIQFDSALVRDLTLTAPAASVTAGGAPLELSNVAPHSTARLAIAGRYVLPGAISVWTEQTDGFEVLAYGADNHFIVNPGSLGAWIGDPSIATVEPHRYNSALEVVGHAVGHTTLTVQLDGAEAQFDVDVPR